MNQYYTLQNGVNIPAIGFGTYRTSEDAAEQSVREALKAGYRCIDCAAIYRNESSVGFALKESGIARDELFITSKLWNDFKGYDTTMIAFEKTMQDSRNAAAE